MNLNYDAQNEFIKAFWKRNEWDGLDDAQKTRIIKSHGSQRDKLAKATQKAKDAYSKYQSSDSFYGDASIGDIGTDADKTTQALGGLIDALSFLQKNSKITEKTNRELRTSIGSIVDQDTAEAIGQVTKNLNLKLGSAKMGAEAFNTLSKSLEGFQYMSKIMTDGAGRFSAALAEQAGMLSKLNLSYDNFTANTDMAIYSLGLNEKEVRKFNLSIKELADDMGMLPNTVSQNLRQVSQTLMYDTATIKEQFVKFQVLSQKTGVDFNTLTGGFGEKMDTISGASGAAASINALLGTNQFSATELLGMEEAERAEAIRAAVMGNEAVMGDIKAGGAAGKFAMISVAEALGMSRDDARRFITTGERDSVKGQLADEVTKRTGVDSKPGDEVSTALIRFTEGTSDLTKALNDLKDKVLDTLDPSTMLAESIRRRERTFTRSLDTPGGGGTVGTYQDVGTFLSLGLQPGEGDMATTAQALRMAPQARESIERIQKTGRLLGADGLDELGAGTESQYNNLLKNLATAKTDTARSAVIRQLSQLADSAEKNFQARRGTRELDPTLTSLIMAIDRQSPTLGQYAMGFALDQYAAADFAPTKEQIAEIETNLKAINSADQVKKFKDAGFGPQDISSITSRSDLDTLMENRKKGDDDLGTELKNVIPARDLARVRALNESFSSDVNNEQKTTDRMNQNFETGRVPGADGGRDTLDIIDESLRSGGAIPMIMNITLNKEETKNFHEGQTVRVLGNATGRSGRRR